MLPAEIAFGTPRKLPKPKRISGKVAVLDVAFAGFGPSGGFDKVTLPFIEGLGDRLRIWVDHHDHEQHARFADDERFVLATKAQHGACPEMISPALVERVGPVDTIVCHTDFDGLASAAKWMRDGIEPYPGCDDDARAIDTRIGTPSNTADRFDRALRGRPRDQDLMRVIVRHLYEGLELDHLWIPIDDAARELVPIENATKRAAEHYERFDAGVAVVDVRPGYGKLDTTLLLLLGQELETVSVVIDDHNMHVAAGFTSGKNFLELFGLSGGMPTRVALPHTQLARGLRKLGLKPHEVSRFE